MEDTRTVAEIREWLADCPCDTCGAPSVCEIRDTKAAPPGVQPSYVADGDPHFFCAKHFRKPTRRSD